MTSVMNDPLGQTHSPASSDHYFHLKFVLLYDILKIRTDGWPVWKWWSLPTVTVGRPRVSIPV